jgi:hypothetical protein
LRNEASRTLGRVRRNEATALRKAKNETKPMAVF